RRTHALHVARLDQDVVVDPAVESRDETFQRAAPPCESGIDLVRPFRVERVECADTGRAFLIDELPVIGEALRVAEAGVNGRRIRQIALVARETARERLIARPARRG